MESKQFLYHSVTLCPKQEKGVSGLLGVPTQPLPAYVYTGPWVKLGEAGAAPMTSVIGSWQAGCPGGMEQGVLTVLS
jgi:hypothetical protein